MEEKKKVLDRLEAAAHIKCSESTFNRLIRTGKLNGTFFRIGRRRFFYQDRLDKWMEQGGEDGTPLLTVIKKEAAV